MNAYASPPNLRAFQARVWEVARLIPTGKVATYGQIAGLLPPPEGMDPKAYLAFGPRWVGGAMAGCPADVPWQRVINSKGEISPRPGAQNQRILLEQEGVEFDDRGRIELKRYRWEPDETWCRAHDLIPPLPKPRQESLL